MPGPLFRFFDGRKYGFIDRAGTVVLPATFDDAREFVEERGLAKQGGLWGYVDRAGGWVIPPRYTVAFAFSEGLAAVGEKIKGKSALRYSYIRPDGGEAFAGNWSIALPFSEGRGRIGVPNPDAPKGFHLYGYIDAAGAVVVPPRHALAEEYSEGLALAQDLATRRVGFLDRTGDWAVPPLYTSGARCRDGRLGVVTDDFAAMYLDPAGIEIFRYPIPYRATLPFSEGLVAFPSGNALDKGYLDRDGNVVIDARPGLGAAFSEGRAVYVTPGGDHGFIDRTGAVAISATFSGAQSFRDGLAQIQPNAAKPGTMAYVDRDGNYVWRRD